MDKMVWIQNAYKTMDEEGQEWFMGKLLKRKSLPQVDLEPAFELPSIDHPSVLTKAAVAEKLYASLEKDDREMLEKDSANWK